MRHRRAKTTLQAVLVVFLIDRIAVGSIGIPMEAMNVGRPSLYSHYAESNRRAEARRSYTIFAGASSRATLLAGVAPHKDFTLEFAKEQFFQTQVPYGGIIYREATRNNLPPELVAAVVEAESDFRPRLVSNKDQRGLMQVNPETGRLVGADDLFDPQKNVAAGARYLEYLVNRFGDERIALAAYNAGEGTVERLGGIPAYPETLDYMHRVRTRTESYRARVQQFYIAGLRRGDV